MNDVSNWVFSETTSYSLWGFNSAINNTSGDIGVAGSLSVPNQSLSEVSVFPNPVNDYIYLTLNKTQQNFEIEIFTILGKSMKKVTKNKSNNVKIDVSNLSKGIYFLSIISEEIKEIKRIIIK